MTKFTNPPNVKLSVIGCGYWGKNLVRNFSELGVLASVCDPNEKLAESLAQQYQVPSHTLEQVLKSGIEAVVIAAPAVLHFELAEKAIKAGKHVFVEKPISLKIEEAKILCDLSEKFGKIIMVGHLLQYHPAFIKLKTFISEGNLGRLLYVYSNRLNLGKFRTEENILSTNKNTNKTSMTILGEVLAIVCIA